MTFWGVEVKSGVPLAVESGGDFMVHLSQACLGEVKKDKGNDSVILSVKVGDKKIVIGTLSSEKFPHLTFDLVFDQDFELSHNGKFGSVHFCGYKMPNQNDDVTDSETEIEEDLPVATNNGKPASETKKPQPPTENSIAEGKRKVKIVEPKKDEESEEETDDSDYTNGDEDESSDEGDSDDDNKEIKIIGNGKNDESDDESDDEDDESDDESDEEEDVPRMLKTEQGKKRSAESSKSTPPPEKKAKFVTPQKTDGKKASVHVATPHPSKKILKTPASSSDQKKEQTQKSVSCKTCSRTFGTDVALQSHKKAKHNAV